MNTTGGDVHRKRGNPRDLVPGDHHVFQLKTDSVPVFDRSALGRHGRFLLGILWVTALVGCLGTDNSKLVGSWRGPSPDTSGSAGSDSQTQASLPDSNTRFTTTLDFRPDYRFSMELVGSDGQTRRTQGKWQIDQATGDRWEVTLQQDGSQDIVRLRIAFDADGFTARQVDGDDRIDSIHYRRVSE